MKYNNEYVSHIPSETQTINSITVGHFNNYQPVAQTSIEYVIYMLIVHMCLYKDFENVTACQCLPIQ